MNHNSFAFSLIFHYCRHIWYQGIVTMHIIKNTCPNSPVEPSAQLSTYLLKYSKKLKWRWNDAKTNQQKYVRFPFDLFQNLILQFQPITNQYKTTVSLSNKSIVVIGSPNSCYWSFYIILHENIRKFLASDSFREYKHFQRVNGVGVKVEPKNLSILENLRFF